MNAQWRVDYTDQAGQQRSLYLSSADLIDARKAHRRARETARSRLAAKGVRATDLHSQCVG